MVDSSINLKQALKFHQEGDLTKAEENYLSYLKNNKNDYSAYRLLGVLYFQKKNFNLSIKYLDLAINLNSSFHEALSDKGLALKNLNKFDDAMNCFNGALKINKDNVKALINRANLFLITKKYQNAKDDYESCLRIESKNINALNGLGICYLELKEFSKSLDIFDKLIFAYPNFLEAQINKSLVLTKMNYLSESINLSKEILKKKTDDIRVLNNIGYSYFLEKKFDKAIFYFDKVLSINHEYIEAINNKGLALFHLGKYKEAINVYENGKKINKSYVNFYINQSQVYEKLKQFSYAKKNYETILEFDNSNITALYNLIHSNLKISDWLNFKKMKNDLLENLRKKKEYCDPLILSMIYDDPELLKRNAEIYSTKYIEKYNFVYKKENKNKINLAYFSNNFFSHAMGYLTHELLENHDKEKFNIFGFSFGPQKKNDPLYEKFKTLFTEFIEIKNFSQNDIIKKCKNLNIDIAIDMVGYTNGNRTEIFSERVAPVQINFLGYPGTMGAKFIDYIVADKFIISDEYKKFYNEKIIFIPDCYQSNENEMIKKTLKLDKDKEGLDSKKFTFCCHNNVNKITPDIFSIWCKILKNSQNSQLWLLKANLENENNIKKIAKSFDIDPKRIVFSDYADREIYLSRMTLADLFLDTYPYNAHTTCSDSLFVGLPVLTFSGKSFQSRVCGSILNALKMNELICYSKEEYINKAVSLSTSKSHKLKEYKELLLKKENFEKLFNGKGYALKLENIYKKIYHEFLLKNKKFENIE